MVVTLKQDTGGIQAPAVTIGARNPGTDAGWKGKLENVTSKVVERVCNNTINIRGVVSLVEEFLLR